MNGRRAVADRRTAEAGFTLLTLMFALAIMAILVTVAEERWSSMMRREREEELIFRGKQIVGAIKLYRKKHPGAYPQSLKMLHEEKFLRQLYKDPMTEKGQWNLVLLSGGAGEKNYVLIPDTEHKETGRPMQIIGVASQSKDRSVRVYGEATTYDKWIFSITGDGEEEEGRRRRPRGEGPRGGPGQEEEEIGPPGGEDEDEEDEELEPEEPEEPDL